MHQKDHSLAKSEEQDLIHWDEVPGIDKYPAIREMGKDLVAGIENTAGASQTLFMDEMMVVGDRPTDIGKLRCLLEQVDGIRRALFANLFKKKEYELKLVRLEKNLNTKCDCYVELELQRGVMEHEIKVNQLNIKKVIKLLSDPKCDSVEELEIGHYKYTHDIKANQFKLKRVEQLLSPSKCDCHSEDELEYDKITSEFKMNEVMFHKVLKKYNGYCELYKKIGERAGITVLTDEMVDKNQPEEQVKTCFMQSLRAAGARDGFPTEGDHMFGDQVKISVFEMNDGIRELMYDRVGKPKPFTHDDQVKWRDEMWHRYKHRYGQ